MKKYRKRVVRILTLIAALVVSVGFLQEYVLCNGDSNRGRVRGFYLEDPDSIDVVFIGASDVYSGFSPGYAYEKFGFTSYPFATTGNIISNYKSQLKTAVKRQHPKLIVVEVNGALYEKDSEYKEEARFRRYVDNIPLDADKLELIAEYGQGNPWEYYLPILKYHSVWKDFPRGASWNLTVLKSQIRGYNYLKGIKCRTHIRRKPKKVYSGKLKKQNKRKKLNPYAEEKLRDLLEYCRSENLDNVVFVRFPHMVVKETLDTYYRSNTAGDIVAEYGYDFINFDRDFRETGLDLKHDFYNVEHLNVYGQRKFTEYLGALLEERYGITASDLTPSQKKEWDICADYYEDYCRDCFSLIKEKKNRNVGEDYGIIKGVEKIIPGTTELIDRYDQ